MMRVAVIGAGSIGQRHIRNLMDIGVTDIVTLRTRSGHLKTIPDHLNVTEVESWDELEAFSPDIAIVSNPTSLHVETAMRLLPMVRGILIEKPLGDTLEGIDRLLASVNSLRTVTFMGYQLEFHPIVETIATALDSEKYGRPLCFQGSVGHWLPDWHPYEDYRNGYASRKDLGGGVALTLIHEVQLAIRWLGEVKSVVGAFPGNDLLQLDVDVQADFMFGHAGKSVSQLHLDYLQKPYHREGIILCERGWLRYDFTKNLVTAQADGDESPEILWNDPGYDLNSCYRKMMETFLSYVREGRERHEFDIYAGARGLSVVMAAFESNERQSWIQPRDIID